VLLLLMLLDPGLLVVVMLRLLRLRWLFRAATENED
jgi:hypothetical protein